MEKEKGWREWKGVGKMSAGSRGSTLISPSLFSEDGKEFSVPWVVLGKEGGMKRWRGGEIV